jgi:hypothetical protein
MAWSEYDAPSGTGQRRLDIRFLGGNALSGVMDVNSSDVPGEDQYQAVIDALNASDRVQSATFTDTATVARVMTETT